jgi:hypothetical protein
VRVSWRAVPQPQGGTPIEAYLVRVSGSGLDQLVRAGAGDRMTVVSGLTPGRAYSVEVAAANRAGVPDAGWRWPAAPVPFTAVGPPGTTPVLITGHDGDDVEVRWSAVDAGGGSGVGYTARVVPVGQAPSCTSAGAGVPAGGAGLSATLQVAEGSRSVIAVTADNGWHCSVSVSDPVFGTPAPVDASAVSVVAEVRDDARDLRLRAPTRSDGTWLEARVSQAPQAVEPSWVRVAEGSWLTPTAPSFAYGRAVTVEVRACAPSSTAGSGVCSTPTRVEAGELPLSLRAEVVECRPLVALGARPPANANLLVQADVVASYLVRGAWTREQPASEPVPAGATQVRAWGVVTYLESGLLRDPLPTEAACGL